MQNPAIFFTAPGKAELCDAGIRTPNDGEILVRTEFTAVSAGTEYACLVGMPNTSARQNFPVRLGYSGVSIVEETGAGVKNFKKGDRVLVYHGTHARYNIAHEDQLTRIENDSVDSKEAAFVIIATMGLGGVRKLEVELGESAMVIGLGLLGMFAVESLSLSGAYPLIAVDFDEQRRKKALELGADYTLAPRDDGFVEKVKELTCGKGVNATVEVTGSSKAMETALECASWMGRVSLLGCTRVSDQPIDYYRLVHRPGVKLIGAHNFVRPKFESYPHHWTHQDDCKAVLKLLATGRFRIAPIISETHTPEDAPCVYARLAKKELPLGVVFDWREIRE